MRTARQMPRLADLASRLRTLAEGLPILSEVPSALNEAFGASRTLVYTLAARGDRLTVDSAYGTGFQNLGALRAGFDAYLGQGPTDWATFNPIRPEAAQRNVPMDMRDIERVTGESALKPLTRTLYPKHGMRMQEQLRLLVCEGPSLLAWVGIFRPEPFSADEKRALQELTPALRHRLDLEQRLALVPLQAQIIDRALEAIAGAAFLLSGAGHVAQANSRGRALLAREDRGLRVALLEAIRAGDACRDGAFEVTRFRSPGMSDHFLIIDRRQAAASPVLSAASRWSLTPRQQDVLLHLAAGKANKTIAAELGCAEATVEVHVSAILAKAGAGGRSELIARIHSLH